MQEVVVATFVTDDQWEEVYARPLERSFKYFHPDIPFVILRGSDINNLFDSNDATRNIRFSKPLMGKKLAIDYKLVVLLDADQLILAPLTELFEDKSFELAGVRSNDDNGVSLPVGAFKTPKISWQQYLNCGLVAVRNPNAWDDWDRLNRTQPPYMNDAEQGLWNEVFYSKKYKTKLLDPITEPVIFGTAANRAHWSKLYMADGYITLKLKDVPRHVKILHKAGVGHIAEPRPAFVAENFQQPVFEYIQRVTNNYNVPTKTIFTTFVTNQDWYDYCALPLQRTFKYFHPNIDFHIFDPAEVAHFFSLDPWLNIGNFKATMGYNLCKRGYNRVVVLDADSLVVAPLAELLEDNWDIVGTRNNTDLDTAGNCCPFQGFYDGQHLAADQYLNAGLVGIKGMHIWASFGQTTRDVAHLCGDCEQGAWNAFFHRKNYNKLIIDPKNKPYYYGIASTWGQKHHWESWKNAYIQGDQLRVEIAGKDKQIKILHKAGGCSASARSKFMDDLDALFSSEVAAMLRKLAYE